MKKIYNIKRTILEEYQVVAKSKAEALNVDQSPSKITVIKITAHPHINPIK